METEAPTKAPKLIASFLLLRFRKFFFSFSKKSFNFKIRFMESLLMGFQCVVDLCNRSRLVN